MEFGIPWRRFSEGVRLKKVKPKISRKPTKVRFGELDECIVGGFLVAGRRRSDEGEDYDGISD